MGLLLVGFVACHDVPRDNPLDPRLTPAVQLLAVTVDNNRGSALLEWSPYQGQQPFAEYRLLRQVQGLVGVDTLERITNVSQTTFQDTTLQPEVEYLYWMEVVNQGGFVAEGGQRVEVEYALPGVVLREAEFSSDTATAELVWSRYRGPGFAAYEVHRKVPGLDEEVVRELSELSDTTYTDSLLDGNTEYTYHILVRTGWEGVEVFSNDQSGIFYPFDHTLDFPPVPDGESQAVSLAVDEQDRLYIAMTVTSGNPTREVPIVPGAKRGVLWMRFPGTSLTPSFGDILPHLLSPIYSVADQGKIYMSVGLEDGTTLVGALNEARQELWRRLVGTEGAFTVGLLREANGDILMVDAQGLIYSFHSEDGQPSGRLNDTLNEDMRRYQFLPLDQVVMGPGVGFRNRDRFFLLVSPQRYFRVVARSRTPSGAVDLFETLTIIDEGIGPEKGQTLNPDALAFDRQRQRLLLLETQGRVQVFDARYEVQSRYITQWGRFGTGDGEFLFPTPVSAAIVVDSRGMIYVADGSRRIQIFAPY